MSKEQAHHENSDSCGFRPQLRCSRIAQYQALTSTSSTGMILPILSLPILVLLSNKQNCGEVPSHQNQSHSCHFTSLTPEVLPPSTTTSFDNSHHSSHNTTRHSHHMKSFGIAKSGTQYSSTLTIQANEAWHVLANIEIYGTIVGIRGDRHLYGTQYLIIDSPASDVVNKVRRTDTSLTASILSYSL